jgi:hypothetical protein
MVMRSAASLALDLEHRSSVQPASLPRQQIPIFARMATLVFFPLTIAIFLLIILARTGAAPAGLIDLPHHLLPGNPRAANATCTALHDGSFRCLVIHDDKELHLVYDAVSRMITGTTMSADEETIGDVLLAWGTPTGYTQKGPFIEVNWGTRSAYLFTCSFQPSSRLSTIAYELEARQVSPWRGFTNRAHGCRPQG